MRTWSAAREIAAAAAAAFACIGLAHAQAPAPAPAPQQQAPAADTTAATDLLTDLNNMTFSCPKAGLNAAAREAAKVASQGTYQFSYFSIINDAHHAAYEVRFKSNYAGEPELKYCVAVYCQQGWDPNTKTTVTLIPNQPQRARAAATHAGSCGPHVPPAVRR